MPNVNPFLEKGTPINKSFENWKQLYPKPYNKNTVSPYTKVRIILMNGTEFEANWFSHQFSRHCTNEDLRREIALIRRREQQQQKKISCLKPIDESVLETTIAYEQLAVDLTAILAKHVKDPYVKKALDFALLEDFDHLYRFSNLLYMDENKDAKTMVGKYTEIMPGRPTISEHRYPYDDIRRYTLSKNADLFTILTTHIITAAEQQTMNFYMNVAQTYHNDLGRKLFSEIAMVEEQHVSQYGSLIDTTATWLECLVMHEYCECYLYYSCYCDESDEYIKNIWHEHYLDEVCHLQKAAELLKKYEGKNYMDLFPKGAEFPELLRFGENKEYVRNVLKNSVNVTGCMEEYSNVNDLVDNYIFFKHNKKVNGNDKDEAGHQVIEKFIKKYSKDFRYEDSPNPIKELQTRTADNTSVGRTKTQSVKQNVPKGVSPKYDRTKK